MAIHGWRWIGGDGQKDIDIWRWIELGVLMERWMDEDGWMELGDMMGMKRLMDRQMYGDG